MARSNPLALDYVGHVTSDEPAARRPVRPSGKPSTSALTPQWFESIVANGPPTFVAWPDGELIFANEAYAELAHRVDPQLTGNPGEAALAPRELLAKVLRENGPVEAPQEFQCSDAVLQFRCNFWSMPDESSVAGQYYERPAEAASEAAHLAHERFEDLSRLVSDWVWEVDEEFEFTYASARVTDVIGVPPRLLLGQSLFDCAQFDGFAEANRTDHPREDSRLPFTGVVCRIAGADHRPRLFKLSGIPIFETRSGKFLGYRGTATDISAQTEAENRVAEAQSRLVHAIETMPQGFALYDVEDRLVLCNSRYEEFLVTGQEMIEPGTSFATLMKAAAENGLFCGEAGNASEFVEDQIAHHRLAARDLEICMADGRWMHIASEMTDDSGIIEVWSDITKMKKRETALRKAEETARLAQQNSELANRTKSEFLANISHELRTPLNAIIGFSEILKGEMFGALGSSQYKEYAEDIYSSGRHLLGLINDILEFSKIEAGKLSLLERNVDFRQVVAASERLVASRAEEAGVKLETDFPHDLPQVRADETKLKQVVINLLSNSIKFTAPGGTVMVAARADDEHGFAIEVSDTGIGISAEDIPKAMSAFGQVDSALSRKYEGTGLGLPLSGALAKLHGGTLTLESEPGVGTKVRVELPAERIVRRA